MRLGPDFDYNAWLAEVRSGRPAPTPEPNLVDQPGDNSEPAGRALSTAPSSTQPAAPAEHSLRPAAPATASRRLVDWSIKKQSNRLEQELSVVKKAFAASQTNRRRDSIYGFLITVFHLVRAWRTRGKCRRRTARLAANFGLLSMKRDPYAMIIAATTDVDAKTRSKWAMALRYVEQANVDDEHLRKFMKRNGGINNCAAALSRHARRARKHR